MRGSTAAFDDSSGGSLSFFSAAPLGEFQYMIYPRVAVVRTDTLVREDGNIKFTLPFCRGAWTGLPRLARLVRSARLY